MEPDPAAEPQNPSWQTVIDAAYDAIVVADEAGRITMASGGSRLLIGMEPDDVVGMTAFELAHPDDADRLLAALAENIEGINIARLIARFRHADGSYVPMELVATNHFNDPAIRGLIVGVRDMGGRNRAELDEPGERHLLHTVLHEVEEGIVAVDSDGSLMVMNRAMFELLKLPTGSVAYTRWPTEVALIDSATGQELYGDEHPLEQLQAGRQIRNLDLLLRRADGSERAVVARGRQLSLPDGSPTGVVMALQDVTAQRAATGELERHALHDALTGLPNRRLLLDRLSQALSRAERNGTTVGVLFGDIDQFKAVNDTFGHSAGDDMLITVANALRSQLRDVDTVARLGGDEFVVVGEVTSVEEAVALAKQIGVTLSQPIDVHGIPVDVSMSIGVAVSDGSDDANGLIRDADVAMYRAKESGRGRIEVFGPDQRMVVRRRLASDRFIADLLDNGQLEARFQPIADIATGRIAGVEALARLRMPDGSLAKAGEFIELAEMSGLVARIDPWMLQTACRGARALLDELGDDCPLVTCNVSARGLSAASFPDEVMETLDRFSVPPHLMCLELTETSSLFVGHATIESMETLRKAGIHLAIDDLGAGFSSLRLLRDLPFSVAKVDKLFIERIDEREADRMIVRGIVDLCHGFGMTVLAEGVETDAQLAAVAATGCDLYQGFLCGAAVEIAHIAGLVRRSHAINVGR